MRELRIPFGVDGIKVQACTQVPEVQFDFIKRDFPQLNLVQQYVMKLMCDLTKTIHSLLITPD